MKQMVDTLSASERSRIALAFGEACKTVLPSGWRCSEGFENAAVYVYRDELKVIVELESVDSELWLHVSMSRPTRIPSYDDLVAVKRLFVGRERKAVQVFPAEAEHYNHHPHCLHLYSPIDRDPLPDFRAEGGAI